MIKYETTTTNIKESNLSGFFVGWPNPPSNAVFLKLLKNSYRVVIARDEDNVIGFITAISDGVLSAYIPFLEVLPEYQGKGVGAKLLNKMKSELNHLYMIDLICDEDLVSYYEKIGMKKATGAIIRNYDKQSGS